MKTRFLSFAVFLVAIQSTCLAQKIRYGNNPVNGKYVPINGIKLYYETYGSGEPLIMLHGNGGNIAAFEKQIPFFSRHYKVIAIDSRLQGNSGGNSDTLSYNLMADDFCALLDYLKLDSVNVLGWSDGGINAILMALHCPKKIKAFAITGANTLCDSSAISAADIQSMRDFVEDKKTSVKEKTLTRMMIHEPNIPYSELAKIKCRALIMAGDHDIIKVEHTIKIYQSIPGAQLCIFPDSPQHVCMVHPELFNKTVYDFFKNLSSK